MSSNQQRKIVEDAPEMRSVAMHSAVPMGIPMLPRPSPMGKAGKAIPSIPSGSALRSTSPRLNTQKTITDHLWDVDETLPALPYMYFLERTHVYVANTLSKEVARRVSDCLRKESISATYNGKEAVVNAESFDNVEFSVRLWSAENHVIVEVQRACGCSYAFSQITKAILRAAKGLGTTAPKPMPSFTIPSCVSMETEEERRNCMMEGLELAISLLHKDGLDAQVMAMESLVHLTKVCKCKGFAAETILNNKDVMRTLISLVEDRWNIDRNVDDLEAASLAMMRRQGLTVLANCLESLKQHGKLHGLLNAHQDILLGDNLLVALIEQVSNSGNCPHEACQACRCLQILTEASVSVNRRVLELDALVVVSKAHEEGMYRHAQLEDLSGKLELSMKASRDDLV